MVNHMWLSSPVRSFVTTVVHRKIYKTLSWVITFFAVVLAWVFFRAETFGGAMNILQPMLGFLGETPTAWENIIPDPTNIMTMLTGLVVIVIAFPNSIEITRNYKPVIATLKEVKHPKVILDWVCWRPSTAWGCMIGAVAVLAIIQVYRLNELTEFIYFNF